MSNIEALKAWIKKNGSWNKGRPWPPSMRLRMSEARKGMHAGSKHPMWGRKHSDATKALFKSQRVGKSHPHISHSGDKANNWKGGRTSVVRLLRASTAYKDWRNTIFERDNYRCFDCGERGGRINADHIYPFALYPRLRFDINNGRTLCEPCHKNTPTYGRRGKAKVEIALKEELKQYEN